MEAKEGDKKVKTVQKDQKDQKRKGKKKERKRMAVIVTFASSPCPSSKLDFS